MTSAPEPTFASLLRGHREAAGLSQEELAERAGVSRRGVSDLERGLKRRPHRDTIARLADALELPALEQATFEAAGRGWRLPAGLSGEPIFAPSGEWAVGNFLSAQPRHRLVARETEMARLLAALETVQLGSGQLVLLVGEPGVGKTRLAQEVLQAARARGVGGITGRCYAPQASVPYYPFLEALTRAFAAAPHAVRTAVPLQWPEVARLIPGSSLGTPTHSTPPTDGGGGRDQQRLFWQVTAFLQALAEEHPLALLVDDLHWADGASLELLLHLARQTRDRPILLLGTYRESEVPADHPLAVGVRDLIRAQLVERLELQQLTREETAALLLETLEAGTVSAAVTDLIYDPTEGNAFFVQELLRTLLERGEITHTSSGRWEPQAGAVAAVPATVQAAILERVSRLSNPAQATLKLASVLGQRFRFDDILATLSQILAAPGVLARAASQDSEADIQLEEVLEEAVRARVLREVGGSGYAFSHALAQRALYESLSIRRRRRLHRAAAESLESFPEAERVRRAADIAYHFLQAEEPARALPYVFQAGQQALLVYAYPEAEQRFRTALELAQQLGDRDASFAAAEQLGIALIYQLRNEEASAVLEPAMAEAKRGGDLARQVRLIWLLGGLEFDQRADPEWDTRLQRLIELAETKGSSPDLAQLYLTLRYQYEISGQLAEKLGTFEHALQVAHEAEDAILTAKARMWHGMALLDVGHLEEAVAELAVAVTVLQDQEDLDDQQHQRLTLFNLGLVLTNLGRIGEAQAYFERGLALAKQVRDVEQVAALSICCSLTAFVRGEWVEAQDYVEQAVVLRPRLNTSSWMYGILYEGETRLQLPLGQLGEATQVGEAHLAFANQKGNLAGLREAHKVLAELDLYRGNPAAARARLLPLLDQTDLVELGVNPLLPLLIWAHLDLGEMEEAEALATQTVAHLHAQHDRLNLVDALRMEAAVRIAQQRWDEAEADLEEALSLARLMPYPYAEAKALVVYGDLLVARGHQERAREQYAAALAILRPLGEVAYTERIERDLLPPLLLAHPRCRCQDGQEGTQQA